MLSCLMVSWYVLTAKINAVMTKTGMIETVACSVQ
jgi:hypothetical protein